MYFNMSYLKACKMFLFSSWLGGKCQTDLQFLTGMHLWLKTLEQKKLECAWDWCCCLLLASLKVRRVAIIDQIKLSWTNKIG